MTTGKGDKNKNSRKTQKCYIDVSELLRKKVPKETKKANQYSAKKVTGQPRNPLEKQAYL